MYPAGNLFIPVEHGRLEAILKEPAHEPRKGVALVLHPHPLGGGTMHNKVVFRAAAALNEAGLTTLRINFRGVGQSTGVHDQGRGEMNDARDALSYLVNEFPGERVTVCGFSFGARVGMEVGMTDPRVQYLVSIGTPLKSFDFSFLERCTKPLLFVHGEHDEFGELTKLRELVSKIRERHYVDLVVVPNTGHFFDGHLDELKQAITEWISKQLAS
jgi:alpha/beta superfamily hydrolase